MKIQKLLPACKDYVWGGEKLKDDYGKKTKCTPCAESWELSFHKDGMSKINRKKTLLEVVTGEELGENTQAFSTFPVLTKFIDAAQDLSIQVHPSDGYAMQHEGGWGKTEMWYIVQAEKNAGIYLGFNRDVSREELETAIRENRLTQLLKFHKVKAGESYFIPAGTIHAIGKGCLVYEIQQNSNLTYRVYDYGRTSRDGKPRELHVEKALDVTCLHYNERARLGEEVWELYAKHILEEAVRKKPQEDDLLGCCKYFSVRKITNKVQALTADEKSFQCITCVQGRGKVAGKAVSAGDTLFVPAGYGSYALKGEMQLILTEIRKYSIRLDYVGWEATGVVLDDIGRVITQQIIYTPYEKGIGRAALNAEKLCKVLAESVHMTIEEMDKISIRVLEENDEGEYKVPPAMEIGMTYFALLEETQSLLGRRVLLENPRKQENK